MVRGFVMQHMKKIALSFFVTAFVGANLYCTPSRGSESRPVASTPVSQTDATSHPPEPSAAKQTSRKTIATYDPNTVIADHLVAKESILRRIPKEAIERAKKKLVVLFNGTSHTSQVTWGMKGLEQYKPGDDVLFKMAFNVENPTSGLEIRAGHIAGDDLSNDGVDANGHTAYFRHTVKYLDAHRDVNVVVWGWCDSYGHDVDIYLRNYGELIEMYRAGGKRGRTKADAVQFVFMSAHANGELGDRPGIKTSPYNITKAIREYCKKHGYFMIDYWNQDTHAYDDNRYDPNESGDVNKQHYKYVQTHQKGRDWFPCRNPVTGQIEYPAHADSNQKYAQHLTGNIRAYAAWWVWARLAGWDGRLQ